MWDLRWTVSATDAIGVTHNDYPTFEVGDAVDGLVPEIKPLKLIDDAQARKIKVARFAHVPVDCLEIKVKTKEA